MISIKKLALALFISSAFVAAAPMAVAEEAAAVSSASEAAVVIGHIEKGLEQVQKSDFSAATLHLKAAREASGKIQGNEAIVKQGFENINQGMIQGKYGDVEKASAFLNKALDAYRSIK